MVHPFVEVTHPSTDFAQFCLISVIEGTGGFNIAYGRCPTGPVHGLQIDLDESIRPCSVIVKKKFRGAFFIPPTSFKRLLNSSGVIIQILNFRNDRNNANKNQDNNNKNDYNNDYTNK
jgi:hypothetical protein